MKKLHLTTIAAKSEGQPSVFIYKDDTLLKQINTSFPSTIELEDHASTLLFVCGNTQQTFSLDQLAQSDIHQIALADHLVIQLRLLPETQLLDHTNLILGICSGVLAISYSFFTTSNWSELLFILGSAIIVLVLFMTLYKNPIHIKQYNLRMFSAISALLLVFLLIPFENWTLKTLLGLSTITVITLFIKRYQRTLTLVYQPVGKP
ncbi:MULTISPECIES: hypothetical protein [unclassified Myroides]|uniref:hypothetical protein n=1 Tax=unclassified Myroides TaxID=2642485 RepID=UPI0015F90DF4|nr:MULTISPECIES: hypothetical protein [unclassified Myroides]MBB1148627.1 hypothetical protein [Myroides sp. NP-2]MDM1406338.1 hypothetical protein [Myroides sp. DF42-4-2]